MIDKVRSLIHDCNNIMVLSGLKMDFECGLDGMRGENIVFDVELEYGYSPEEIMTEKFLRNRVEIFYRYYKNKVLTLEQMNPSPAHYALADFEKQGKLLGVITRSTYGLHQMAGIKNVTELHGSVQHHFCPKCNKDYNAEYVLKSEGIPYCMECNVALRPGVALFGEHLDNGVASKCAVAVEHSSLLIIAGSVYDAYLARMFLPYYKGKELIIINDDKTVCDSMATYILNGKCKDILPLLL